MSGNPTSHNFSIIVTEVGGVVVVEDDYDRILTDLWVGITLSVLIVSCVGLLCTCFIIHKFQQWKFQVLEARAREHQNPEAGFDAESLPSYTLVTGLPSYAEAMEQLKQVRLGYPTTSRPTSSTTLSSLSAEELMQYYKSPVSVT